MRRIPKQRRRRKKGGCLDFVEQFTLFNSLALSTNKIITVHPLTSPASSPMSKQFKCQRHKANKPHRNNPRLPSPLISTFSIVYHKQLGAQFELLSSFPDTDDGEEIVGWHKHRTPTEVEELHITDDMRHESDKHIRWRSQTACTEHTEPKHRWHINVRGYRNVSHF